MNINLRYKLLAIAGILASVFLYGRCSRPSSAPTPTVLPSTDKEQIIVNPEKHQLIIVKPTGNETLTLPDHQSVIDIHKDGTVSVTSPQHGFEHKFFFGLQGTNVVRIAGGLDFFYFKKLDLGLGVASRVGSYTPVVFIGASYTVYDNLRLGVTFDNQQHAGLLLTVRI